MNAADDISVPLIVQALQGKKTERTPVWLMRQAGRYLPEYRALREEAGGFLQMAYHPERAAEVTLQPIRRFGMDGAILFSDILVIPHALGQDLSFLPGDGPRLDPVISQETFARLDVARIDETLAPVYEAVSLIRARLKDEGFARTALIGFAGAPWTVACYMVEGRGVPGFAQTRAFAAAQPELFAALIDLLCEATAHYLIRQVAAGAQLLQIFDSWAALVPAGLFESHVIAPTKKIIASVKAACPDVPVIGFPRGVEAGLLARYVQETGVDGIGCGEAAPLSVMTNLQSRVCVQGNLSPTLLLEGGPAMEKAARDILETLAGGAFIFNLGHGVIKETPPSHVDRLVKLVQEYQS